MVFAACTAQAQMYTYFADPREFAGRMYRSAICTDVLAGWTPTFVYNVPIGVMVADPLPTSMVDVDARFVTLGVPPNVYVPVTVPLNVGDEMAGDVIVLARIVGLPPRV